MKFVNPYVEVLADQVLEYAMRGNRKLKRIHKRILSEKASVKEQSIYQKVHAMVLVTLNHCDFDGLLENLGPYNDAQLDSLFDAQGRILNSIQESVKLLLEKLAK